MGCRSSTAPGGYGRGKGNEPTCANGNTRHQEPGIIARNSLIADAVLAILSCVSALRAQPAPGRPAGSLRRVAGDPLRQLSRVPAAGSPSPSTVVLNGGLDVGKSEPTSTDQR
jgi:hypothetical protein